MALDAITTFDAVDGAASLLMRSEILVIKGLGGFQLAGGAANADAVAGLRERKRRARKPFAMMARDLDVIRAYCDVSAAAAAILRSAAALIVLLAPRDGGRLVAAAVAPAWIGPASCCRTRRCII